MTHQSNEFSPPLNNLHSTKNVCHLTSAHPRNDIRIFVKQCQSLAANKYNVSLIVADNLGDDTQNRVATYDVGKLSGRINRILKTTKLVYQKALLINADIYHLHDPELIPIGLKLKKAGKKVIFDAHEDLPKQTLSKPYLGWLSRQLLSRIIKYYERYSCSKFDAVVAATPSIANKFLSINPTTVTVNNFPILDELSCTNNRLDSSCKEICYVGGITEIRGIKQLVRALGYVKGTKLNIAGSFSDINTEKEVKDLPEWSCVNELGQIDRKMVAEVMARSQAGVVTFLPSPNHLDAQPNKMFEYMSAGLPIITSNFSLWREIVENNNCGICVDPLDSEDIARAINYLVDNPSEAKIMGKNGQKAVHEKYNWDMEWPKLVKLYEGLYV